MEKIKINELIDLVIRNFQAPISMLEVNDEETRLINGLPITYLLRFISRKAEENKETNGEFEVEVVSKQLMKVKTNSTIMVIEQDTFDNVLNFDIG